MIVSYGVLTNSGALSLMSVSLTITGIVRFLCVDLIVQINCKLSNKNFEIVVNKCKKQNKSVSLTIKRYFIY